MINFRTWRTYLLPVIILSILLITGCRGCRDGTGEYTEPVLSPKVASTDPINGATGVATNKVITATFSKTMLSSTIGTSTFSVTEVNGAAANGVVTCVGLTAYFTPTVTLASNATFTAMISTGVKDSEGNALAANYIWTFQTGDAPDAEAPTVASTDPANGAVAVASNKKIAIIFSEGMNPTTIDTTTIKVTGPGLTPVTGVTTYVGQTAYFTPVSEMATNTFFTATITNGVKDLAGNAMTANYLWTFTTGSGPDITAPAVTSTDPANGDTDVASNKKITVIFSEGMDAATINATTFKVAGPGGAIAGTVTYAGLTANFAGSLLNGTTYTATITAGAKDLANNFLTEDYTWTFITGAAPDAVLPIVVSTSPVNGAENVAPNQTIAAVFSEVMDSVTISPTTFKVFKTSDILKTSILGTVTYVGLTANFTPTAKLDFNTSYTATIASSAKDLAGLKLATSYAWSFTTGAATDLTAPTVTATNPADKATDVANNTKIAVTFSENMDSATISNVSFTLKNVANGILASGTVSYSGLIAQFTPSSILANSTAYTATISNSAKDLSGNALAANYVWNFTTGALSDTTRPTVISPTDPADKAKNVATNKTISATFSEGMNSATINTTTFSVKKQLDGSSVAGAVTYVGQTAYFDPTPFLESSATYTCTIATGPKDLAGNLLVNKTWIFTTSAAPDTLQPTVTITDPANTASGVAINTKVSAIFSETMNTATINTTSFTVSNPSGANITGTVIYVGKTATFSPTADLESNATYTARIFTSAKDLAGNALAVNYVWSFTTGLLPDTTQPTVIVSSTDPAANETGVVLNKTLAVTFSEGMNSATINATTFTLVKKVDGMSITGAVSITGMLANFNPDVDLDATASYTATITTGAKDLAGNSLATNYVWEFQTGAALDTTAPKVFSTNPGNNETDVAIGKKIALTFDENMDASTISNGSFSVKKSDGTTVIGTVSYAGKIATFTPSSNLSYNATYTATMNTMAQDLAGNDLAADYIWSFHTGLLPDTTPPTVFSTDPANQETGVAFNKTIAVTFSESMTSTTINAATFTLKKLGGASVLGTVSIIGLIAKFDPDVNLDPTATYTASIATGAKDLAGNAIAASYTWDFQTGAAPDILQPTVTSTDPAIGLTDVPLNQDIKATFSENMDPATINDTTFKIAGVTGIVSYDLITRVATFKLDAKLAINAVYTATIASGAKDLAGNSLNGNTPSKDYVWTFTTGLRTLAQPVALGSAKTFGNFGGSAGMTNQGTLTQVKGDIGTTAASTLITGFHDSLGNVFTESPLNIGAVTGIIYTATMPNPPGTSTKATVCELDTQTAFNNLTPAALPGGVDVSAYGGGAGDLGNRTLKPGIYKSAPGSYNIQGGPLTLDGQNDANAVWVFQMSSTLTVGGPGAAFPQSVILINGAQAKNVFWQVSTAGTINAGGGGNMVGTIIAQLGVTFSTAGNVEIVNLNGRALSLISSVTLVNTVITLPAE